MSDPVVPVTTAPVSTPVVTPTEPTFNGKSLMDLNGEEAKAYVESLKAPKETKEPTAPKVPVQTPKEEASISDIAKEAIKKWKVKVDGKEEEVDENELVRGYSHQKAANKKLQEGIAAKRQAEEFIALMKDPSKFYEAANKLGHDPRKLAEEYLAKQLEDELLDPRDKELKIAREKLKKIDEMEAEQKRQVEAQRMEQLEAKYTKDYNDSFVAALAESKLPATKPMVAEMAKYISRSAKIGFEMTPSEAAQLVKEDIQKAQLALFQDADGDTLLRLLGDQTAAKILQARGAKVKTPEDQLRTPSNQGEPRERVRDTSKRMTPKEWKEFNRKK
jgi:hypothetical protein